jgi:hypothetical protein
VTASLARVTMTEDREAVAAERWEHGSDLHYLNEWGSASYPWDAHPHSLWGSAREAFSGLVLWGQAELGWGRVWVPGYYCEEVVPAFTEQGIEVSRYRDSPLEPGPDVHDVPLAPRDVLIVVNYFGLRGPMTVEVPEGVVVVEDHSHDPFARGTSMYCVASFRKTLAVPDGGSVWSPQGLDVPPDAALTPEHALTTLQRLSAMLLKSRYLAGEDVEKQTYRELLGESERLLAHGTPSGVAELTRASLPLLPVDEWIERRRRNFATLRDATAGLAGARLLLPVDDGATAFVGAYVFDDHAGRERTRERLVANQIFPALLWPTRPGATAEEVDLFERILVVHCDQRYDRDDMLEVAASLSGA